MKIVRIAKEAALTVMLLSQLGSAAAQSPSRSAFDVASIKLHRFPPGAFGFGPGNAFRITGNTVKFAQNSLTGLVATAYDIKDYQVEGMPS